MVETLEKIGAAVLVGFIGLAVISFVLPRNEFICGYVDPDGIGYSPPSATHILGKDFMGRDLFRQVCSGAFSALWYGLWWSLAGVPVLVGAAFIMARLREETPQLEDTAVIRYCRFIAFPLGVVGLLSGITFLLASFSGRISWVDTLFFAGAIGFMGWLAVGHDMEVKFRKREKIPQKLLLSGAALIGSYAALYDAVVSFFSFGDPMFTTWGMLIGWCFRAEYGFDAVHWWLPPLICIYVFSQGMLSLSYGLYNAGSEKYFVREGWF